MKLNTLIAGMAMSMAVMGSALAEDLATMEGIPAEAMSHGDMDKVEGKGITAAQAMLLLYAGGYFNQKPTSVSKSFSYSPLTANLNSWNSKASPSFGNTVPSSPYGYASTSAVTNMTNKAVSFAYSPINIGFF